MRSGDVQIIISSSRKQTNRTCVCKQLQGKLKHAKSLDLSITVDPCEPVHGEIKKRKKEEEKENFLCLFALLNIYEQLHELEKNLELDSIKRDSRFNVDI